MHECNECDENATFWEKRSKPLFLRVWRKDALTHSFDQGTIQQVVLILVGDWAVRPV